MKPVGAPPLALAKAEEHISKAHGCVRRQCDSSRRAVRIIRRLYGGGLTPQMIADGLLVIRALLEHQHNINLQADGHLADGRKKLEEAEGYQTRLRLQLQQSRAADFRITTRRQREEAAQKAASKTHK